MSAPSEAERRWREAHKEIDFLNTAYLNAAGVRCLRAISTGFDAAVRAAYREGTIRGLKICNEEMPEITAPPWLPHQSREDDREPVMPGDETDHIPGDWLPGAKEDK